MRANDARRDGAERLLAAALRLFAEKGYERTTIPDIQAAAGLSPGSGALYKHFPSKEAVLVAIVDRYIAEARSAQSALAELDLPPREGLAWIGKTMLKIMAARRQELRIFWRDLEQFPELQARVRERVMQATYAGVAAWLDRQRALGRLKTADSCSAAAVLLGSLAMFRAFDALWGAPAIEVSDRAFLAAWQDFAEKALGLEASPQGAPRNRRRRPIKPRS
jgi:AcrR family transcriptional regulator